MAESPLTRKLWCRYSPVSPRAILGSHQIANALIDGGLVTISRHVYKSSRSGRKTGYPLKCLLCSSWLPAVRDAGFSFTWMAAQRSALNCLPGPCSVYGDGLSTRFFICIASLSPRLGSEGSGTGSGSQWKPCGTWAGNRSARNRRPCLPGTYDQPHP